MRKPKIPLLFLVSLCAAGCTTRWYRESAEREVSQVISAKQTQVEPREKPFSLAQNPVGPDEVGSVGEVQILIRTPPPAPRVQEIGLAERHERALLELREKGYLTPARRGERDLPQGDPSQDRNPPAPDPAGPPRQPDNPEEPQRGAPARTDPLDDEPDAEPSEEDEVVEPDAAVEVPRPPVIPGRVVDLEEMTRVALANNRDYQSQREDVYLSALRLTLTRHEFAPQLFGIATGDWTLDADERTSGGVTTNFGFNWLLISGARVSVSVLNNFFRFFRGNPEEVAQTFLSATLTQPVMRGFGRKIVEEPLTQAWRDVLYEIRAFERFRKTFAVDVISQYYRVLAERNRVSNEYANWQDLVTNHARVQSFADSGESTQVEADQAEQEVLQARNRWVDAVESYAAAIDRLKITLGLPTTMILGITIEDLEELAEPSDELESVDLDEAIETALGIRLDLMTARDRVEDAQRRVEVAADALRMQLDVTASASLPSGESDDRGPGRPAQTPLRFNSNDGTYGFGFDVDLPLDRKAERNEYVRARIELERSTRDRDLFVDNVRLTVRDAYRSLGQQRETYEIQNASVTLARQRVDSTTLLLQAGEVSTRDLLESQSALIDALNNETSALINYTIARLKFYRDTGTMRVGETGTLTMLLPKARSRENEGAQVEDGTGD